MMGHSLPGGIISELVSSVNESSHELQCRCWDAAEEISRLRNAIIETLAENAHLADGDNCTLIKLKRAISISQKPRETWGILNLTEFI